MRLNVCIPDIKTLSDGRISAGWKHLSQRFSIVGPWTPGAGGLGVIEGGRWEDFFFFNNLSKSELR